MSNKFFSLLIIICMLFSLSACAPTETTLGATDDVSQTQSDNSVLSENETTSTTTKSGEFCEPTTSSNPTVNTEQTNSNSTPPTQNTPSNKDEPLDHPGLPHIFGEETILVWPTALREGYYGKRCAQTTFGTPDPCRDVQRTKTIPKRAGDYSSIDSAFEIEFSDDDPRFAPGYGESYKMIDIPQFSIVDERISGAVPTIFYDRNEGAIVVTAELGDGSLCTQTFFVEYIIECINDGCLVSVWISEEKITLQVGRLSGSGG